MPQRGPNLDESAPPPYIVATAMATPLEVLESANIPCYLHSFSALDRYFRIREPGPIHVLARSSLVDVARLFDEVSYAGSPAADVSVTASGTRYLVKCVDEEDRDPRGTFTVLDLLYDAGRDVFLDPRAVYPDLRKPGLIPADPPAPDYLASVMDAATIVSRYHYEATEEVENEDEDRFFPPLAATVQRELLTSILSSRRPDKGLRILAASGFLDAYWPELAVLSAVDHTKDHHPEGDVWEHTLQTFAHRKTVELSLSLGLLFHDVGKAVAPASGERRFDAHAEHSARIASRFLRRLEYPEAVVEHVCFVVRYHMMPAALRRLPDYRTAPLMRSPYFPNLLELYYADLSSSFLSPEGYYDACRIYRRFLRRISPTRPLADHEPSRKRSHFR
jgi:poly(A) polymerase